MKKYILIILLTFTFNSISQTKTIHIFVALCDNKFQGIVPVPEKLGDGKNPSMNLYWGAMYGFKSYFKYKTNDWKLVKQYKTDNKLILERLLFKHKNKDVYILADAYDGEYIQNCIEDFLIASNCQKPINIKFNNKNLEFGGNSDLISYIGHNGLMEFNVDISYKKIESKKKDAIILACASKNYFIQELKKSNSNPILWTTNLMAPEAYTLKYAIDGWLNGESGKQIKERASQAYNKYQKCGINGARRLFTTGF